MFKDFLGQTLFVGDHVIKPSVSARSVRLERRVVERIENGRLYLNDSKGSAVVYPGKLIKIHPSQYLLYSE